MMDNDLDKKIKLIDKKIEDFSSWLSGGNQRIENEVRTKIRNIFLEDDFDGKDKWTQEFVKILSNGGTEIKTDTIIRAKEVSYGMDKWINKHIEDVRICRGIRFTEKLVEDTKRINSELSEDKIKTEKLVEDTKKINPGISEEKIETVRRLSQNINQFYNNDGGIENQKDEVLKKFKNESPGKIKNAWNDVKGIVGILRQSPQKLESLIQENEQINKELEGVKLPYQQNETLSSYDRVMNSVKNPEMRRFLETTRNRFQTLDRISGGKFSEVSNKLVSQIGGDRIRNVANNFVNKSVVKISNGFASKIGNQAAGTFVQNSMNTLLKNGISGGMKSITQGLMKKGAELAGKTAVNMATKIGLKGAAMGLKTALGAATGGLGYVVMAAWEGLKLVGKFMGNLISSLGLELTNNKFVDTTIIIVLALFILLFGMNQATADVVSSLVPETESSNGSITHGEITHTEDGRIRSCGVGMETDFKRNKNVPPIEGINDSNLQIYNKQLEDTIGSEFGTRCGVVYAAHYLAYDFNYWVMYQSGGVFGTKGLNTLWGTDTGKVDDKGRYRYGLDCAGFRDWVQINGRGGLTSPNIEYWLNETDCSEIKNMIEPGDAYVARGDNNSYHIGIVLEYEGNIVKFAHSGGGSGVTTGTLNMCTGQGDNDFNKFQKRGY